MPDRRDQNAAPLDCPLVAIETRRLMLRRRVPSDAADLFVALSDRRLMRWWSGPPFQSVADLRDDFIRRASDDWRSWSITRKGDDRAVGFVASGEKRPGVSEIAYLLVPAAMGQGIAHEAMTGLIGVLFAEGQRRVFADTDPENVESIALLQRLGFTLEGRLREEWHTHIGIRDSLIFGLLAGEWRS